MLEGREMKNREMCLTIPQRFINVWRFFQVWLYL